VKDPVIVRELIQDSVPLHELLADVDVHLSQVIKPHQMSCPFHGADTSKSARHYPDTNSMHCFACKKSWDVMAFWMQLHEVKFMEAARQLAAKYRVDLSKVAEIKAINLKKYSGKNKGSIDKRKMALYLLGEGVKSSKNIENPGTFAKMLYVFLNARHIEDEKKFAKVTLPLAKRLSASLS
jgi:hypothetical protein